MNLFRSALLLSAAVALIGTAYAADPAPTAAKAQAPKVTQKAPKTAPVIADRADCVYSMRFHTQIGCDPDPRIRAMLANDPPNTGD